MLRATGIIRTVDKHSIVSTLHGGGGAAEQLEMNFANRPSIFGQDCRLQGSLEDVRERSLFLPPSPRACIWHSQPHSLSNVYKLHNDSALNLAHSELRQNSLVLVFCLAS